MDRQRHQVEVWLNARVLSISKRDAYTRYADLPLLCSHRFELAANMHASDPTHDRAKLMDSEWTIVDPHVVASTPARYRRYIAASWAELACPKPIFRELRTGWISDRSAAYLASGRPVLAEDTGFAGHVPTGEGLLSFSDLEAAVAAVEAVSSNPTRHRRAAREIAESHFSGAIVLPAMLEASLAARSPVAAAP